MKNIKEIIKEIINDKQTPDDQKLYLYGNKYLDEFQMFPTVFKAAINKNTNKEFLLDFIERNLNNLQKEDKQKQFFQVESDLRKKFNVPKNKAVIKEEFMID